MSVVVKFSWGMNLSRPITYLYDDQDELKSAFSPHLVATW